MANEQKREIRRVAGALAAGMSRLGLSEVEDPRCASQVEQRHGSSSPPPAYMKDTT